MSREDGQVLCVDSPWTSGRVGHTVSLPVWVPGRAFPASRAPRQGRPSSRERGRGQLSPGVHSGYPGCATELPPSILRRDAL